MQTDQAIDMVREALLVVLQLSTPILLAGLVIGLIVSILQAVTQVQEQTLSARACLLPRRRPLLPTSVHPRPAPAPCEAKPITLSS